MKGKANTEQNNVIEKQRSVKEVYVELSKVEEGKIEQ